MANAARKGDPTAHGGVIVEGSPDVSIGYMPAARLLDKHVCPLHGPGPITQTSFTVFINGVGAARVADKCTCMVPSKAKGGGSHGSPVHAKITIAKAKKEKNFKEAEKGFGDEKEGEKSEQAKGDKFKPKLAGEVSKNFGEFGNEEEKKGAFETNIYGGKGTAKASADMQDLRNAKAQVGAEYEVEYTGARLKGETKAGDVAKQGWETKGSGEAKLLTAKADLKGEGKFAMKGGKLDAAYAEGEVGAGGSVVEATGKGSAGFKIPFINWKVSLGGEVSGSLLTAEAKASGHAGYKDHKWSIGGGAKLGAFVAGLGLKFNLSVEKIDPPEEPDPPPGIPGVTGIDPIAAGCATVCIGGMPPAYVPGPPPPAPPPSVNVDGLGKRNSPQELTLSAAKRSAAAFAPVKCPW